MSLTGRLRIDLAALADNWRSLDRLSGPAETAAVVKANAYGCGVAEVGRALAATGARTFFVALPAEGAALRAALGPGPVIHVLSGFPIGAPEEAVLFAEAALQPVLNSPEQIAAWRDWSGAGQATIQLDSGMNRLGLEPAELAALGGLPRGVDLVMSHLCCSDTPDHPMNATQLAAFHEMTAGLSVRRSLAATGGVLLGRAYRFDMVRPGVGLYGGLPFAAGRAVVELDLPILQIRPLAVGETVGYGASWTAARPSRIATLSAGYADGLSRHLSNRAKAYIGGIPCAFAGRVSMDLIGLDVTAVPDIAVGDRVEILGPHQGVDALAEAAGTIGYEVLTSLGARYVPSYVSV